MAGPAVRQTAKRTLSSALPAVSRPAGCSTPDTAARVMPRPVSAIVPSRSARPRTAARSGLPVSAARTAKMQASSA